MKFDFCKHISSVIVLALLATSCAKMGNPDGGWFDEEPPYVVATTPGENEVNFHENRVYMFFNEYIKVENAQEKIIISPPQIEQAEIKVLGKAIRVELKDSLKDNTTYTIDFSDCISDNNEGNPMGNYTFTFSTGDHIDTMEVAGNVIDAETLEPIKGVLVGLHEASAPDSAFQKSPLLRVSRTDGSGHFVIKGVARDKEYHAFALEDMDGDFRFSQKAERLAFSSQIIRPDCYPDTRLDTVWADELHIKDFERRPYTHFTPDNIVLRMFQEKQTDRNLLKTERKSPEQLTVIFMGESANLPIFTPLNFAAAEGQEYLVESSLHNDSITYWLSDSILIKQDSLTVELKYEATDTLGLLVMQTDTIEFIPKLSYERRQKLRAEEVKKWAKEQEKKKKKDQPYETEMPAEPLEIKWNTPSTIAPDQDISFTSPVPLALINQESIHLKVKQDTLWTDTDFSFVKDSVAHRRYILKHEWIPGNEYKLEVDSFAIRDIYDRISKPMTQTIRVGKEESYGTLTFELPNLKGKNLIVQLLMRDNLVKESQTTDGNAYFYYLKPGEYYARVIVDDDYDGKFTTGEYDSQRQPEMVYYYPKKIEIKEKWDIDLVWNTEAKPLDQQKPEEITKQKADKKRTNRKGRNLERARKLGIKFLPDGTPVTEKKK